MVVLSDLILSLNANLKYGQSTSLNTGNETVNFNHQISESQNQQLIFFKNKA